MPVIEYRPLKQKFTKLGYTYTMVKRNGDFAIYKQQKSKKIFTYEVIVVSRHDGYTIADTFIEPSELYPCTSEWGFKGFTCTDLESANKRFDSLQKSFRDKEEVSKTSKKKK